MNWLITGGCGFIGTSLIDLLIKTTKDNIRVVDNLSVGTRDDLGRFCQFQEVVASSIDGAPQGVELLVADIVDEGLAVKACSGIDVIVHLAANTGVGPSVEDPRKDCITNVIGTLNYLEAARTCKVPRFVFASSGAPVGEVDPPIHEEMAAHPVSPYGASKLAGEGYCSAYKRTFGIDTVALRFGNVYGPGSLHKDSVVARFLKRAFSGECLEIYGDGHQTRDFLYIDDLLQAVILAATVDNVGGEIFQIATSSETTVEELTDEMLGVLERRGIAGLKVVKTKARLGDVKRNYSDTEKARSLLGWEAKVRLSEGLDRTTDYFVGIQGE